LISNAPEEETQGAFPEKDEDNHTVLDKTTE